MANYSLSVNLAKLDGAKLQTAADGKMYMCIPVQDADLSVAQNGGCYLNLSMWESRPNQYNDTHAIKQSLSKLRREQLGDAARQKPFLGNAKEIKPRGTQADPQQDVYSQQAAPLGYAPVNGPYNGNSGSNLAF